jgi:hypothetical protein
MYGKFYSSALDCLVRQHLMVFDSFRQDMRQFLSSFAQTGEIVTEKASL